MYVYVHMPVNDNNGNDIGNSFIETRVMNVCLKHQLCKDMQVSYLRKFRDMNVQKL